MSELLISAVSHARLTVDVIARSSADACEWLRRFLKLHA